jgi:membrane glycosyltransferase
MYRFDARIAPPGAERSDLPEEAPLAMPVQDLRAAPPPVSAPPGSPPTMAWRRGFLIVGSFLIGIGAAWQIARPFAADGNALLASAYGLLAFALFAWIAFGFLNALAGFGVLLSTGPGLPAQFLKSGLPRRRTAVLLPIYNEEVEPVFRRLRAMAASVEGAGAALMTDFFVLSDSHAAVEAAEREAFCRVRAMSRPAIYYRRRPVNHERKPGNIAEWVRRFGGAYEHMIVLDADSLMTGEAMARLAATMEANPHIGLIQTVPAIRGGRTLFARWQEFAAAAYGPVASAGLRWWSGNEATFWGHNAIIRVRAFAESCGLPTLTGRAPFGGPIMSHDMFEATLLRRRGWAVRMLLLPDGSYEEYPPTLADHAVRDRRWAQGNIQHLRVIDTAGLHWVGRLHLLMGASAYLTAPLWLLLMLAGLAHGIVVGSAPPWFAPSPWLVLLTLTLLFAPKLLALLWLGVDEDLRRSLGGGARVLASVAIELPLAVAMAPVFMLSQTIAIVDIARGRVSGWRPQRRAVDGVAMRDALSGYRIHMIAGALLTLPAIAGVPGAAWTLPVSLCLLASPWLYALTARTDATRWMIGRGLFVTTRGAGGGGRWRIPPPPAPQRLLQP